MKTEGEYFFNSFDEAFNFVKNPTIYERNNKITIVSTDIMLNWTDIRLVERKTSDNRSAIIIFFKNSKNYDVWKFWMPSDDQMTLLEHILPAYVKLIIKKNAK